MTRVKKGINANKHRRNVLKDAKGYRFGRSKKEKQAKEALHHAGAHAFAHRKDKKADFRRLWQVQIGTAVKPLGLSYSKFIDVLKKKNILLNRKMLAELAEHEPKTFEAVVTEVKSS